MRSYFRLAIAAMIVLASPSVSATGQYHYMDVMTQGQTVLGQVSFYVGGVLVGSVPADTFGQMRVIELHSDAGCMAQYHHRQVGEDFYGSVAGKNPEGGAPLVWTYSGLTFLANNGEHVSFSGDGVGTVWINFGQSTLVASSGLDAITVIVRQLSQPDSSIHNVDLYQIIKAGGINGSPLGVGPVTAEFHGHGPGAQFVLRDIDWDCP